MEILGAVRDDALKRAIDSLTDLITEADDVSLGPDTLRQFSQYATRLRTLLVELHRTHLQTRPNSQILISSLHTLDSNIKKACLIIKNYKSGSRLRFIFNRSSILDQLHTSAREIARAISLLHLANLDTTLKLKSKAQDIITGLESLEFNTATSAEAITTELEKSITQNGKNRDYFINLLNQISTAVGVDPDTSLVSREITMLKREKEELEERKEHAEALQLSQLIQLLYSTEMVSEETPESIEQGPLISLFTCPLTGKLIEDPVAIVCGDSFEREAIVEYFGRGERRCPKCKEELTSLEVTLNISLKNSIQEWKQRTAEYELQNVLSGLDSDEPGVLNRVLEDLRAAMETRGCTDQLLKEEGVVSKLVGLLKREGINIKAALKCLCYLAHQSNENKEEIIAQKVAIKSIVKMFRRGEIEPESVELLLELSHNETLAELIGRTKDSIHFLVYFLQNSNPEISETARSVLLKFSSNVHFVIKMAEAGHFEPFLACFYQGQSETRAKMASELTRMQFTEGTEIQFEDDQFINALTKTLYSNSPACKSACLHCIRKLTAFQRLGRLFLADRNTIPALLGLMSSMGSEPTWKHEATEILILLVRASQLSDYESNPSLRELHSEHNIHLFLQLASSSLPQTSVSLLVLLLAMVEKSDSARNMVCSNVSTMTRLFSILEVDREVEVRLHAMNLISFLSKDHTMQLPPSPTKDSAITALLSIFTSSPNNEERAAAAEIIGFLPNEDDIVQGMIRKSVVLKAIHEVLISATIMPNSLLENSLAALLQYTEPTKPELQRQVADLKIYPSLIHVLSTCSCLAKQRAARALAQLSQSTHVDDRGRQASLGIKSWWCFSSLHRESLCSIHGSLCSSRHTFCLVKAEAVRPLVQTMKETDCGASEAAMMALDTLLLDDRTISKGVEVIVENQGVDAIIELMERGCSSAKDKALDLFLKILMHSTITDSQSTRSKSILIHHLLKDDALKRKAALVLSQMDLIPAQSSYF